MFTALYAFCSQTSGALSRLGFEAREVGLFANGLYCAGVPYPIGKIIKFDLLKIMSHPSTTVQKSTMPNYVVESVLAFGLEVSSLALALHQCPTLKHESG